MRSYRSEGLRLRLLPDGSLRDAEGSRWTQEEEALVGPEGRRLAREPGVLCFWFAWQAFHPDTSLHGGGSPLRSPVR